MATVATLPYGIRTTYIPVKDTFKWIEFEISVYGINIFNFSVNLIIYATYLPFWAPPTIPQNTNLHTIKNSRFSLGTAFS